MATLYTEQSKNIWRTWGLMTGFLVFIVAIGWIFSYVYDSYAILVFAVVLSLVMNFVSYWQSDKIALSLAGAVPADEKQYLELHRVVENLSITAGLPKPRVYIINDPAPNAFATGRNKEHAAIAVTTGLLQMMERSELEGVIAHELSHVGNRDILLQTVIVVLVGVVAMLSDIFLRMTIFGGRGRDNDNRNGLMLVLALVAAIVAPIAATLIQLAISRKREFLADASGVLLTRYPEGLASALKKIGSYEVPLRKASNAMAHLYISNPFGAQVGKGLHKLFQTHPPIDDRIKALLQHE